MSLMWIAALAVASAPAAAEGTALWLSGVPDPTLDATLEHVSAADVLPERRWTEADARVIARLEEELSAVQPLLDVFDGELQIMRRLDAAIASVEVLRSQDRELMFRALVFQGLAVHRYFQDGLATEEGAAPYRIALGGQVEVRPWIDAVALAPDRQATAAEIPEAPELLLFQEVRARHLLRQSGLVRVVGGLPAGGTLSIDGQPAAADEVRVLPGMHRVTVEIDGQIVARRQGRVDSQTPLSAELTATAVDAAPLAAALSEKARVVDLPAPMVASLSVLPAPVHLIAAEDGGRKIHRYVVEDGVAVRYVSPRDSSGLGWRVAVGGGWVYDGDYLLQNHAAGAPDDRTTVNAGSPLLSAGVEYGVGQRLVAGVGVDALLPLGEWSVLPSGETDPVALRARLFPHLSVGLPALRATAGFMTPWHVGLGPRAHYTVLPDLGLEVTAAYVYGLGVPLRYDSGETFTPDQLQTGWVAVGLRR